MPDIYRRVTVLSGKTDRAHSLSECSNTGYCNRQTGICDCFTGYTGSACQRSKCPNDCNRRGMCLALKEISLYYGPDYDTSRSTTTPENEGDGLPIEYSKWDNSSQVMCACVVFSHALSRRRE